jgi:8-oxo-dGTP pyrophosphatase MutT (NUDIX family)
MSSDRWKPHVTVAAIVERNHAFLCVEESVEGVVRINQPAGHLEPGETLEQAVIRECLEETGYVFVPQKLVGVYQWCSEGGENRQFIRFAFAGEVGEHPVSNRLDAGIISPHWYTPEEIMQLKPLWRSEMVGKCVLDYVSGHASSLDVIRSFL